MKANVAALIETLNLRDGDRQGRLKSGCEDARALLGRIIIGSNLYANREREGGEEPDTIAETFNSRFMNGTEFDRLRENRSRLSTSIRLTSFQSDTNQLAALDELQSNSHQFVIQYFPGHYCGGVLLADAEGNKHLHLLDTQQKPELLPDEANPRIYPEDGALGEGSTVAKTLTSLQEKCGIPNGCLPLSLMLIDYVQDRLKQLQLPSTRDAELGRPQALNKELLSRLIDNFCGEVEKFPEWAQANAYSIRMEALQGVIATAGEFTLPEAHAPGPDAAAAKDVPMAAVPTPPGLSTGTESLAPSTRPLPPAPGGVRVSSRRNPANRRGAAGWRPSAPSANEGGRARARTLSWRVCKACASFLRTVKPLQQAARSIHSSQSDLRQAELIAEVEAQIGEIKSARNHPDALIALLHRFLELLQRSREMGESSGVWSGERERLIEAVSAALVELGGTVHRSAAGELEEVIAEPFEYPDSRVIVDSLSERTVEGGTPAEVDAAESGEERGSADGIGQQPTAEAASSSNSARAFSASVESHDNSASDDELSGSDLYKNTLNNFNHVPDRPINDIGPTESIGRARLSALQKARLFGDLAPFANKGHQADHSTARRRVVDSFRPPLDGSETTTD